MSTLQNKPRVIDVEYLILAEEMEIWENGYRQRHCTGKTDEELEKSGWWKDNFGNWYCMDLGKQREKKFRKRIDEVLRLRIV